ncbi:(E)-4-hydroxy-3-methylbut-2-enyl-diphosphate synthase [Candidatus Marinimicrobia bacterium]|nr:(E)-4-hydroxy-3-methylbut-2-enyl-diphosphate synthase [Candidatus Neomarinimicrobiota bacterium]
MSEFKYCKSIKSYNRFLSREVAIGNTPVGGANPIRVQSMTTTNTMNTEDTINQSIRMIKAGSEYVRITAPSKNEAKNLKNIQDGLNQKGYNVPLIADIHFTPSAAELAAQIVSKVRINPGNYADKKKFKKFEISDFEYNLELERIYDRFSPLVKICKEYGTAMRIGTNHGSLSDRIMNRYGDTPLGMVESALEFIRIAESLNYYDMVLSMKSSNPIIMVNAYRLLINKMLKEDMNYPLHLGVTEAGDGMEGRVKSSLGIGTLLEDGIGDTIRVSLTEEPEMEIPVAKEIISRYEHRLDSNLESTSETTVNPFYYTRRQSSKVLNFGCSSFPRVISDLSNETEINYNTLANIGYSYLKNIDKWIISDVASDYIHIGSNDLDIVLPPSLGVICNYSIWKSIKNKNNFYPEVTLDDYIDFEENTLKFLYILSDESIDQNILNKISIDSKLIIVMDTNNDNGIHDHRNLFFKFLKNENKIPVIISKYYKGIDYKQIEINSSIDIGGLLVDGFGDGIFISNNSNISIKKINELSFSILQASRVRISKTEFISCPSCGRTQFDLQETTSKVRKKTSHLKGLKIAIMGCIVNGPGEMADADYGYVGTGKSKISLYKGHNLYKSNISESDSITELVDLIKLNNDWVDPT